MENQEIWDPESETEAEENWETLKAVPRLNLSRYKIASQLFSAFEILSGHCQTGKLTWKKEVKLLLFFLAVIGPGCRSSD